MDKFCLSPGTDRPKLAAFSLRLRGSPSVTDRTAERLQAVTGVMVIGEGEDGALFGPPAAQALRAYRPAEGYPKAARPAARSCTAARTGSTAPARQSR